MKIERFQDECTLCRATIYVPLRMDILGGREEYCGLCSIHLELSAIRELLEELD